MLIQEFRSQDERTLRQRLVIKVDGRVLAEFWDGEPEDNNLYREFSDCYKIGELMRLAYEAGKNGSDFEHQVTKSDWNSEDYIDDDE